MNPTISQIISTFPPELQSVTGNHWQSFEERLSPDQRALFAALPEAQIAGLLEAFSLSDFVARVARTYPDGMIRLAAENQIEGAYAAGTLQAKLNLMLASLDTEAQLHQVLRQFRQYEMCRIVWRDLTRKADMYETVRVMSELADACIDGALSWLYSDCCQKWGVPIGRHSKTPQRMIVLGMGKLGAYELNVSSDIDLMFCYPENGETEGVPKTIENQQFFIRLGQKLIQALDSLTADGFVFRVDMRLRPWGDSGALAMSFNAMEEYYQDQGRDWERYAMIKARVVAGDSSTGADLLNSLKPFVYRKYIDYSAFESLREMKGMINREVRRKGVEHNIKLGRGGIREIEFVVQAFQLIRGGRDVRLQTPELMRVLAVLADEALLPVEAVTELKASYEFLRNLEHGIQGMDDRQSQLIPEDKLSRARLAKIMKVPSWTLLEDEITRIRERVSFHFAQIIAVEGEDGRTDAEECGRPWKSVWLGELSDEAAECVLRDAGFEEPQDSLASLKALSGMRSVAVMQAIGRERLDYFMPLLLNEVSQVALPSVTLRRVLLLVQSVVRRTSYLVLLYENQGALQQLVWLCSESPWVAELLAQTPLLLDELLNKGSLFTPPDKAQLRDELRQQMLRIPEDDLEQQMECLRLFKKAHVLRVAASEVRGTLPLMKVSDYLTWIAEAILEQVVEIAWHHMVAKHGYPVRDDGQLGTLTDSLDSGFAVIGYGKLGGIELGYTSDLDLVFIHGGDANKSTSGEKSIDTGVFYTRLGQRIIHILSTQTAAGDIYEVDMRLRPSGNSGLLVSSLKAFEYYQQKDAWTWEHQALVRARCVAGSERVAQRFNEIRATILGQQRDPEKLREDVATMRVKMRENLGTKVKEGELPSQFHIKQDEGGIVDIEFMAQYAVLGWSHEHPGLLAWPDNVRILETMGLCGVLPATVTERLTDIYKVMRSMIHKRALQKLNSRIAPDAFQPERAYVTQIWKQFVEGKH